MLLSSRPNWTPLMKKRGNTLRVIWVLLPVRAFRAGDEGLTYLAEGTWEPNDIAQCPDSGKVNFRGIVVITRLERLDYRDGEQQD
jgi:hypothetical protein